MKKKSVFQFAYRHLCISIPMLILSVELVLLPRAKAVSPPPDGGYPGGNTAEGQSALLSLTTGTYNTGLGIFSLLSLSGGNFNTANGAGTLLANTADENTATGAGALLSTTTGSQNTAIGAFALFSNTLGAQNTADGAGALQSNTTGTLNIAIGFSALLNNTTGSDNIAIGEEALLSNVIGGANIANGAFALHSNTDGNNNTANGASALFHNTTGSFNTADGDDALVANTVGNSNTAVGIDALDGNTTGNNNVALGFLAGANVITANNVICIGEDVGGANVDDTCFIGNIFGVTTAIPDAVPVVIDSTGQLGTQSSSQRFKKDIKPMESTSNSILDLKPVTFHYKSDQSNTPQFGLIAEEVAKVNPDLVVHDKNGEIYTVRYDAVNAMLLNEFLKEHRKVEQQDRKIQEQEATISQLKEEMETVIANARKQDAKLQRVSDRIELARSAPQTAGNDP
jgi:hypothetical protein